MFGRYVGVLLLVLSCPAAALADELTITIDQPVEGAVITSLTCPVRVHVSGAAAVSAVEIVKEREGRKAKHVLALEQLEDGRWGGDVEIRKGYVVVARDAEGREARAALPAIDDRSGWITGPEILAPGAKLTDLGDAKLTDLNGVEIDLSAATPTLVVFYSTWNDCESELAWIRQMQTRYAGKGLRVVGVASVTADRVEAWKTWLAEREVDWASVADTANEAGKSFFLKGRKAVGNADAGTVVYFCDEGVVLGGDYSLAEYLSDPQLGLLVVEAMDRALR